MFQHFKNIDTAFKHVRLFSFLLIAANVFCVCFCIYKSYALVDAAQNRVHILYNGKVLEALAADRKVNLPVELRDHIRVFHEDFFTLVPDDKAIQATVTRAFYLADESAKRAYDNLREAGYYNNLVSGNIDQQVTVDSIRLGMDSYPYAFTCFATEKLVRSSSTVTRRLVTQGTVSDLKSETDNNPHGFLIRNWEILQNDDVKGGTP
ncbi:conjugative transposon protein TraK [Mucilaginibacter sp. BJC16-A38]|uniref:conjugative transposon protein TraK n=1 Tax=Mucilaginibacter phenanthrenivorans TaxID=1234842 RepID=UPI0021571165|nr:conjugative transposon protein TraK [Mucilaginibacter phenanthrenivorans]MCR8560457.1 conjugative transposon protein TraK [Mucilaginibacter phenanthrenivorans]